MNPEGVSVLSEYWLSIALDHVGTDFQGYRGDIVADSLVFLSNDMAPTQRTVPEYASLTSD